MAFKKARAWADDNVNLVVVIVMPLSFAAAIYALIGLSWAPAGYAATLVLGLFLGYLFNSFSHNPQYTLRPINESDPGLKQGPDSIPQITLKDFFSYDNFLWPYIAEKREDYQLNPNVIEVENPLCPNCRVEVHVHLEDEDDEIRTLIRCPKCKKQRTFFEKLPERKETVKKLIEGEMRRGFHRPKNFGIVNQHDIPSPEEIEQYLKDSKMKK